MRGSPGRQAVRQADSSPSFWLVLQGSVCPTSGSPALGGDADAGNWGAEGRTEAMLKAQSLSVYACLGGVGGEKTDCVPQGRGGMGESCGGGTMGKGWRMRMGEGWEEGG